MRKNLKKTMAGTLSVCMLATGVPGVIDLGELVHKSSVVYAATTKNAVSGECGEKATWQYDTETKVLTISGSGVMDGDLVKEEEDDYGCYKITDQRPWKKYKEEITKVVIADGITEIAEKAFYDCKNLKSISIGKAVKTIGDGALAGCNELEKIEINSENEYFMMDENNLVNKEGTEWHGGCFTAASVCHISGKINKIDTSVIKNNPAIESIEVSSENETFSSKDGLLYSKDGKELYLCPLGKKGTVTVQEATTVIGDYDDNIFKNCAEIEKIVLGKNVGIMRFNTEGCDKLKEIEISEENSDYLSTKDSILSKDGKTLLYCVSTDNGTYKIPDGVENIDDFAFHRAYNHSYRNIDHFGGDYEANMPPTISIEHVIFPDSLKNGRLQNDSGIVRIFFKGIKSITLGANYYDGKKLRWLIEYVDKTDLEAVYVSEENPYYSSVDGILYDKKQTKMMLCPNKAKICRMPDTVKDIYSMAFRGETGDNCLEELEVSDSVEDISSAKWVFGWYLKKLHVGEKVNDINVNMYAKSLEELTVSSENKTYKAVDNVLYTKNGKKLLYCPKKKSGAVTVSEGTTTIGASAFYFCKNVTEITLPASVKKVNKNAFKRIADNAVFKVPAGKKKYFKKLLTSKTGFKSSMTIEEIK